MTLTILIVLALLLAAERWERMRLQERYLQAVDTHASTIVELVRGIAGIRTGPPPPAEVQAPEEPEQVAERRAIAQALERMTADFTAEGLSPAEAAQEARSALAAAGMVL